MGFLDSETVKKAMGEFDTETVTITRSAKGATPGTFTTTTIYSGAADFQLITGSSYEAASGAVEQSDAELTIDPAAGALPACVVGDLVEYSGNTFTIVQVATWSFPIAHLSAMLKRGVQTMKNAK